MGSSGGWVGGWSPGIGDPSFMGWVTVVAYFVAAFACYRAYRRSREVATRGASAERRVAFLWFGFMALLLALGVNKQLDLQSLLTEIGRRLAYGQGWYEERRAVQRAFVVAVAVAGGSVGLGLVAIARGHIVRLLPALGGACFLLVFVLVRASSFHHVDAFIATDLCGLRMNWIFELGGIAFIGFTARRDRPPRASRASAPAGRGADRAQPRVR
jgi:hypothetical protein